MTFVVVLLVGAGSYLFRVTPLLVAEHRRVAPRVRRLIDVAGAAAITTVFASSMRTSISRPDALAVMTAVLAAALASWRGWSLTRVVALGGAVYAVLVIAAAVLA